MNELPDGWPRMSSGVFYDDAHAAIDFLCKAFGFELRLKVEGEGGRLDYSELVFGEALLAVHQADGADSASDADDSRGRSPRSVGRINTQFLAIIVDDVDAHCARATAAGAKILQPPATKDYGDDYWTDRSYRAEDPEGHRWAFWQRLRDNRAR